MEETPKKLKDVIDSTWAIRHKGEVLKPEDFNALRETILMHELISLQTIAFDLTVEHPYKHVINNVKRIQGIGHSLQLETYITKRLRAQSALVKVNWNFCSHVALKSKLINNSESARLLNYSKYCNSSVTAIISVT